MSELPFHGAESVESIIRAARNYVLPSEELRPRTVEAARQYCEDRRAEQKLGGFALAVALLVMTSSPAYRYVDLMRTKSSAPTAAEIQSQALEYEKQPHVGTHWGMAEAFTQLRRAQASRLGHAHRSFK